MRPYPKGLVHHSRWCDLLLIIKKRHEADFRNNSFTIYSLVFCVYLIMLAHIVTTDLYAFNLHALPIFFTLVYVRNHPIISLGTMYLTVHFYVVLTSFVSDGKGFCQKYLCELWDPCIRHNDVDRQQVKGLVVGGWMDERAVWRGNLYGIWSENAARHYMEHIH